MSGYDDLLKQYKPQPRYDRQEAFFADAADQMAVNPGNQLHVGGKVMATAETGLTLDSLGPVYKDKTQGRQGRRPVDSRARTTATSTRDCASHGPS